jgi:hypothetical protein
MKKILLLIAVFLFIGCGTRKKALDVSKVKTEITAESDVKLSVKKDIAKETVKESETIEIKSDISATFEGKVSESTKPASIEESVKDGIKTTVFKNFKEVKTSNKESKDDFKNKQSINQSIIDKSLIDLAQKQKEKQLIISEKKLLTIESEKPNGWSSLAWSLIGIAIVLVAGVIFYFWNYRKKKEVV